MSMIALLPGPQGATGETTANECRVWLEEAIRNGLPIDPTTASTKLRIGQCNAIIWRTLPKCGPSLP